MPHPQQIYDRERISLNIVRLKKGGKTFEIILSDPDAALRFRQGESIDVTPALRAEKVFCDARKGLFASENDLKELFGTAHILDVVKQIIKEGEFHLTQEQKREILDQKKEKIMEYIHLNAADPKTSLPHPRQRIELAMEQAKVHINMHESALSQTEKVVQALRPILPMSFEKLRLSITVPSTHASRVYSILKTKFDTKRESWLSDGSVLVEIETQAGKRQDIFDLVNKLTKGEAQITEAKE